LNIWRIISCDKNFWLHRQTLSPSMSHYGHNVFCRSSTTIQLLVVAIAKEEEKRVHSSALESREVRIEKHQQN
jgi:hypothetical protein